MRPTILLSLQTREISDRCELPPALARWLTARGHDARHVQEFGREDASDRTIWNLARELDACILTKDEDFVLLHAFERSGPAIVWVRMGNVVRRALLQQLAAVWPDVEAALSRGEKIVELR